MSNSRRRLLTGAAAAVGAAAAGLPVRGKQAAPGQPKTDPRPNIVLIVADDMRATDWQALPKTRVALQGATEYPNFFCQFPVCSPARTTLLTGLLAHNHGVLFNTGPVALSGYAAFARNGMERRSIPVLLQRSGYLTGLVGKFMHGYDESAKQPDGWSRWVAKATGGYTNFDLMVDTELIRFKGNDYATDVLARYASEFIETAPPEQPLFLYFSPTAPHEPYQPAPRHRAKFSRNIVTRDAGFNEADTSDKPTSVAALPPLTPEQMIQIDETERQRLRLLASTDEAVSALVRSLRTASRLDNTVIMFVSDNGYIMGQHRLFGIKGQPYDQAVRVPMLAWGPGFKPGVDKRVVSNADVAPTIADLAGIKLKRVDGVSLLGRTRRDYALLQLASTAYRDGGFGLRSAALMYFEYDSGDRELYDLRSDPLELVNFLPPGGPANPWTPADIPTPAELSAKLALLKRCRGSRCVTTGR
ncbi:MAG: sulfatase [Chloroflexota bacterium]